MYDIETIGTRDNAPIVQIGAVMFSPNAKLEDFGGNPAAEMFNGVISAPGSEFRRNVIMDDSDLARADWSTIEWWLRQEPEAQRRVFRDVAFPLMEVLLEFEQWTMSWGDLPAFYWSDMDFDARLLRQAYRRLGIAGACPLDKDRRAVRDYRTLKWIGKDLGLEAPPFVGVQHDALDDAYHQALVAVAVLRKLGVG
jgi:exodeoxyribonuclease VIII